MNSEDAKEDFLNGHGCPSHVSSSGFGFLQQRRDEAWSMERQEQGRRAERRACRRRGPFHAAPTCLGLWLSQAAEWSHRVFDVTVEVLVFMLLKKSEGLCGSVDLD